MNDKTGPWGPVPSDENDVDTLNISCPSCGEENKIRPKASISCRKCAKPLTGGKRYVQLRLASYAAVALLASGGTWGATAIAEHNRYPILLEHAIVESCINGSNRVMMWDDLKQKRQICGCALERTQEDFDLDDYEKDSSEFLSDFEKNTAACRNQ